MPGFLSTGDVDSLGDDDISQILGLNSTNSQQDKLALQMKLAGALRNKGLDKGQMAGAVYIPPNPLGTAMDVYDHLNGIMQGNSLPGQSDALDAKRQAALNRFAKMWFGKSGNAVAAQDPNAQDVPQGSNSSTDVDAEDIPQS